MAVHWGDASASNQDCERLRHFCGIHRKQSSNLGNRCFFSGPGPANLKSERGGRDLS